MSKSWWQSNTIRVALAAILAAWAAYFSGEMELQPAIMATAGALLAIFLSNNEIPVPYLYSLWLAPTVMQGSVDPTNSWTLWTIGYTKVSHGQFLRTALPVGCIMVAIVCTIGYLMLGRGPL